MTHFRSFAYIPTGHRGKFSNVDKHEYFGDDFLRGKSTIGLFKSAAGRFFAVWSSGDWDEYGCEQAGQSYTFKHTQSMRSVEMTFVRVVKLANFNTFKAHDLDDFSVTHWTLK